MDLLKKVFPFSFKATDVAKLIIAIIIYLVLDVVAGFIIGLLKGIPIIKIFAGLAGSLLGIYGLAGIVIAILVFVKVIKYSS